MSTAQESRQTNTSLLSGSVSRRELLARLGGLGFGALSLSLLPSCPGGSTWVPLEERERLAREAKQMLPAALNEVPPSELRVPLPSGDAPQEWAAGKLKGYVFKDTEGQWLALSRTCTHSRCPVSWRADESVFHCKCHGSRFDLTGAVLKGPAKRPLPGYPVREEGGELVIDLSDAASSAAPASGRDDDEHDDQQEDKETAPGWNP